MNYHIVCHSFKPRLSYANLNCRSAFPKKLPLGFFVQVPYPIASTYGIFTYNYIYHKNQPNVGKYTIHGWYGLYNSTQNFYNLHLFPG